VSRVGNGADQRPDPMARERAEAKIAAQRARDHRDGRRAAWFIPSQNELAQLRRSDVGRNDRTGAEPATQEAAENIYASLARGGRQPTDLIHGPVEVGELGSEMIHVPRTGGNRTAGAKNFETVGRELF
jgi:hypothetical protein